MNKVVVFDDGISISVPLRNSFDTIVTRVPSEAVSITNRGGILMMIVDTSVHHDLNEWLPKINRSKVPPIMVAISDRNRSKLRYLRKSGFNIFFTRPFNIETFVNIIIRLFGGGAKNAKR